MRLLFIWPNKDQFGFKPISISLLSAILKEHGHKVDLFDTTYIDFGFADNTEVRNRLRIFKYADYSPYDMRKKKSNPQKELLKKLKMFQPDVVGISALSDEIFIAHSLCKTVKGWNPEVIIIWGNKAATMNPEDILRHEHVDYVCVGEGIELMPDFMDCLRKGEDLDSLRNLAYRDFKGHIQRNPLRPYYQDLDSLPFLDWTLFDERHFLKPFDGKVYRGGDHMLYWGCPNWCTYCINQSYRELYNKYAFPNPGRFIRYYSVPRIIQELEYLVDLWDIQFFKFHDEDFCLKPMRIFRDLANEYAQRIDIPFTCMANARNITEEKIELLKKMNCVSVSIGIETGNDNLRKNILKRRETKEEIIQSIKMLNRANIRTSAFNMLGIPFETRHTIMETIELNRDAEVRYSNAGFFFPLEGTPLRDISIENNFFETDSKLVFRNDVPVLRLPTISVEEMVKLHERFVLYIKLPKIFQKYIKRSEKDDSIGHALTETLYHIYDECVFSHDGVYNDGNKQSEYLSQLERIYKKKAND